MRETRLYGSEGGGAGTTGPPYPYPDCRRCAAETANAISWTAFSRWGQSTAIR